jgi:two-component system, chemotaxis family, sensor kinase CheA
MDKQDRQFQEKLLATFKVEAAEHVQVMSSGLIELEQAQAEQRGAVIESVFREAHSLKGAARAVGVAPIESICQGLESVFSAAKAGRIDFSPELFDVLHQAVDALGTLLLTLGGEPKSDEKVRTTDLVRRLDRATKAAAARGAQSLEVLQPARHSDGGASVEQLQATPPASERDEPVVPAGRAVLADTIRINTAKLDGLLFQVEGLLSAKLTSEQRAAEMRDAAGALAVVNRERGRAGVNTLHQAMERSLKRDTAARADAYLRRLLDFIAWEAAQLKSLEAKLNAAAGRAEHDRRAIAGMVDGLLEDMKKALMQPVSAMLETLPKFLRDLARAQGKEVELIATGGEIEIDRRILEEMRDPLIHLVRNCMDHGIETPEVRRRCGKAARGTITFTAAQKDGSRIEIVVADDGAGIDVHKVQQAAFKVGVAAVKDAQHADADQALPLVFQSGVSTSPIITDLSGRGLGLAIVREKVEKLGGVIALSSEPGRGTAFRILLPLTLATLRGVHVLVSGRQLVVPTNRVVQALRVKPDLIKTVENRETIQWNGQTVALVHLADVLELPRRSGPPADTVQVIILGTVDTRIAFCVDEILHEQELLMKPLGKQLSRVRNVAGASVLGNGKAVPVLDVPDLIRSAVKAAATPVASTLQSDVEGESASILVAEDSITSRTLLKNILESAGYTVATAVDGADAFTLLKTQPCDLVISDVEMPHMSGFDLTAKIRADAALAELPVVLVTALESRADREHGIDVGANAYIVKSSFDQSNLLDVVRRLI